MNPNLEFHLSLPKTSIETLVSGELIIKEENHGSGIKLKATSGQRRYQYIHSWVLKGRGQLPPSAAITPHKYTVSTQRLRMDNVPGVGGSFYAISPFEVVVTSHTRRGDFGIHFDSNAATAPGSAGCCVVQIQDHWDLFRDLMQKFRDAKFQSIPLLVIYT